MMEDNGSRRSYDELRNSILASLSKGQMTLNLISKETGINWRTVDRHLTFLMGSNLVKEVLSTKFVRVFELTHKGKEHVLDQNSHVILEDNKIIEAEY